ncbi:MAG: hypothetical protein Q9183_003891, partial [Haloplaca sp. 2 TL-2023]
RLAELGASSSLIDTVYISPREQDMAVFDAVTQHPVFKCSVRHLLYDTAEFLDKTQDEYTMSLSRQFQHQGFDELSDFDADYRELHSLVYGDAKENGNVIRNLKAYKHRYSHPLFVKSYQQWTQLAKEQKNVHDQAWFLRAKKGLEAIGPLCTVAVHNSFSSEFLGKSPVARAWPCTTLQPNEHSLPQSSDDSSSTLTNDPLRVFQLLNITRKQPVNLLVADDLPHRHGQVVFCHSADNPDGDLGGRLHLLELKMGFLGRLFSHEYLRVMELLHNAPMLRHLSLQLSSGERENGLAHPGCFALAFPRAVRFDFLSYLQLQCFKASYHDLAALLFDRLPKLEDLYLGHMQLVDGDWWDILEGLCHRCNLQHFCILTVLIQKDGYSAASPVIPGVNWVSTDNAPFVEEHIRQFILYGKRLDPSSDKSAERYSQKIKEWVDGDYGPENCHTDWWIPDQLRDELAMEDKDFNNSKYFWTRLLGGLAG